MPGFCRVELNPFGPLQEYEVPPPALRLRVAPVQMGLLLAAMAEGVGFTVTVKLQVVVFPATSFAVYVTVVVTPTGKLAGASFVKLFTPQLSVAVGAVQVTDGLQVTIFAGQLLITGTVLSTTVTLKEQTLLLVLTSVATYVTKVVPTGKTAPGA
jgi:hypothetical protein